MKLTDIAWLAGLLEGDGYFTLHGGTKGDKCPVIGVAMTDEGPIIKAATILGAKVNRNRTSWIAQIYGAKAIGWMMTLYPLLHKRRRERITSIIKYWRGCAYLRAPKGYRFMATCHPDRVSVGFGSNNNRVCRSCYNKQWRKKNNLPKKVRIVTCHPDKPYYAFGLCKYCYDKKRYEKKQLLKKAG